MTRAPGAVLEFLLLSMVPPQDREAVAGDLMEAGPPPGARRLWALTGIVVLAQIEPWRDGEARLGGAKLLLAGLALLWAIPAAARLGAPDPSVYSGLLLELATSLWRADHLVAAAAAGLVLGHVPGLPRWADAARCHGALLLTLPAFTLGPHVFGGLAAVALLHAATWFGRRASGATGRARPPAPPPRVRP